MVDLRPRRANDSGVRPGPTRELWLGLLVFAAVVAGFAMYTGQVWEDYLITFRQSRNLATGAGLVYQAGEHVQGFTSPLNVLIPAAAYWIYSGLDYVWPLWAFRIVALAVMVTGIAGLFRLKEVSGRVGWLCLALLVLQNKTIAFAMNGQEAALMIGFLAPAIACAAIGQGRSWKLMALCWTGLMWSRPDSPLYIAGLALAGLCFAGEPRLAQLRGILKAALLTVVLYGPWFVWTWIYYGTPVPHTITAKFGAVGAIPDGWQLLVRYAGSWIASVGRPFEPIYAEAGGWPGWLVVLSRALGLWCALRWTVAGSALLRVGSGVYFIGTLYLGWVGTVGMMYPWYFPPLGLCGALVLALEADLIWRRGERRVVARILILSCGGATFAALAGIGLFAAEQQRVRQLYVENGVREQVGRWLKTAVPVGERVFLEPIGYIGYFSDARLLDYPGLVTPLVVEARRKRGPHFSGIIDELSPEWLVLRNSEFIILQQNYPLLDSYAVVKNFGVRREAAAYLHFPGSNYLLADSTFVVLRRVAANGSMRTAPISEP